MDRLCPELLSYRAPYLVRLIKPNLIASHDWHVQPICQRSLRVIRLSETPWIEAQTEVWIVLELDCATLIFVACTAGYGVLARTFQDYQSTPFRSSFISTGIRLNNPIALRKKSKIVQRKKRPSH